MSNREVRSAINIALALAGAACTADLILHAIHLSGFEVVQRAGGASAEQTKAPAPRIPERWPKICSQCNKVVADKSAADACDNSACPI